MSKHHHKRKLREQRKQRSLRIQYLAEQYRNAAPADKAAAEQQYVDYVRKHPAW